MTTTTDLLRRAAELLRKLDHEEIEASDTAASLLALADQMERAEPVACSCELGEGHSVELRDSHSPLYLHPAPEVTRDAERLDWLDEHAYTVDFVGDPDNFIRLWSGDGTCVTTGKTIRAAIDSAMQEPKP